MISRYGEIEGYHEKERLVEDVKMNAEIWMNEIINTSHETLTEHADLRNKVHLILTDPPFLLDIMKIGINL